MPVNEFLPFAAGVGANVIDQATWQVLPGRGTGFVAGTALSRPGQQGFAAANLRGGGLWAVHSR
jgi:hypothetical protein